MLTARDGFVAALTIVMCAASSSVAAQAPPSAADSQRLSIDMYGEVRMRSEWDRPMATLSSSDVFTLMRSRLGVRITPSSNVRIVMEAQDSRVLGDVSSTARQTFNVHQGYLQIAGAVGTHTLTMRAGRQEIALANERLVGALAWTNFGRAFDGLRLTLAAAGSRSPTGTAPAWSADVFGATIEERGRHFGANRTAPENDHVLAGAFLTRALNASGSARAELTALVDVGSDYRAYRDANRSTLDVRVRHADLWGVRIEAEGAVQVGSQQVSVNDSLRSQSVQGWLAGLRVGNTTTATSRMGFMIGGDVLSGDRTPTDAQYSGFSTLYGTNHALYGLIDLFLDPAAVTRERGLQDLFVQGDARISSRVRMHGELHRMLMATGEARDLGWEADVVIPISVNAQTRIDVGYSAFRAGEDAPTIGLGPRGRLQQWAYVQLRAAFQP